MKLELKIGSIKGHTKDGHTTIRMASLEVEGDATLIDAAMGAFGQAMTGAPAPAALPPASRVQRCGNCGVLGHKRPTCTETGGGQAP